MTSQISFDTPLGALLTLALFALLASGIVYESGLLGVVRSWITGGSNKLPRRIATVAHRS